MSFCRWSDEGFGCDLYVYAGHDAYWVHVAAKRIVSEVPVMPVDFGAGDYQVRYREYHAALDKARHVPIGLPHDGETFLEETAADMLARVLELRAMGYRVPDWAVEAMREEIASDGEQ